MCNEFKIRTVQLILFWRINKEFLNVAFVTTHWIIPKNSTFRFNFVRDNKDCFMIIWQIFWEMFKQYHIDCYLKTLLFILMLKCQGLPQCAFVKMQLIYQITQHYRTIIISKQVCYTIKEFNLRSLHWIEWCRCD